MLSAANVDIRTYLPYFANLGLPVAFIVPTPTGLKKSIMDATGPVRETLLETGIHDYSKQAQGNENKVYREAYFMEADRLVDARASLYRPTTKNGDPRIWFSRLGQYAQEYDLLALVVHDEAIYVINLSRRDIVHSMYEGGIGETLYEFSDEQDTIADELLSKLVEIHHRGFLRTITDGDPGVGDTLEHALGIARNNRRTPDYRGIELKAKRIAGRMRTGARRTRSNRSTLFDQVPDWRASGIDRNELLDRYGWWDDEEQRLELYCTLTANRPNPQGLYLQVEEDENRLVNYCQRGRLAEYVLQWQISKLQDRLLEKHPKTFWVEATSVFENGVEYFKYDYVTYTRDPNASLLPTLIDEGIITVDYLLHRYPFKPTRDHGFPFKINGRDLDLLFPEQRYFDLSEL
ncbi:MAG: hypothetical protein K5675_09440 [Lachnospiraceae bacterium]|nr:hypothetical protein [Lachnospiraceae bacterium]